MNVKQGTEKAEIFKGILNTLPKQSIAQQTDHPLVFFNTIENSGNWH